MEDLTLGMIEYLQEETHFMLLEVITNRSRLRLSTEAKLTNCENPNLSYFWLISQTKAP